MKIFRYLKTEWKALILVSLLLFAQAIAELSLPAYTSGLVNIGVAQSGVRDALAERLAAGGRAKFLNLNRAGIYKVCERTRDKENSTWLGKKFGWNASSTAKRAGR